MMATVQGKPWNEIVRYFVSPAEFGTDRFTGWWRSIDRKYLPCHPRSAPNGSTISVPWNLTIFSVTGVREDETRRDGTGRDGVGREDFSTR